ncbi:hypothetical protein LRS74_24300 [Streptomyces sp. LX-29]|uniref:hypothetical protein n=1 Tax=Streptomyces sp. LX-29 TaxID=2900152 RepID=UPI00240D136E|nr:hypothetical protein [Streptomyces sp. LX-29]WFB09821.1 hypothetical protein LRS74_24300 [Streptomyces sp. LX-29]
MLPYGGPASPAGLTSTAPGRPQALAAGYGRAFLVASGIIVAGVVLMAVLLPGARAAARKGEHA